MNRMARIEPLRNAAKGLEDLNVYRTSAQQGEKVLKDLNGIALSKGQARACFFRVALGPSLCRARVPALDPFAIRRSQTTDAVLNLSSLQVRGLLLRSLRTLRTVAGLFFYRHVGPYGPKETPREKKRFSLHPGSRPAPARKQPAPA